MSKKILKTNEYEILDWETEEYADAKAEAGEWVDRYARPARLLATGEYIMVCDYDALNMSDRMNFLPYWVNADIDLTSGGDYPLEETFKSQAEVNEAIRHAILEMTEGFYWDAETLNMVVNEIAPEFPAGIGGGADEPLYRVVSDLLGQDVEYVTLSQIQDVANDFEYDGWALRVLVDDWHVVLEAVRDGAEDWKPSRSNEWRDGVGDGEVWTLTLAEIKVD